MSSWPGDCHPDLGTARLIQSPPDDADLPATVTAARTMEVTGLSISSTASPVPFALGKPAVGGKAVTKFPVTLTAGQQLTVPITFTPTTADAVTGSLAR